MYVEPYAYLFARLVLKEFEVEIYFDLLSICYKFKLLGFIHLVNDYPVGNSRYLNLTDRAIVRNFSYIYFMVSFWFLDCDNYFLVRNFLNVLSQSCFLTLSRKHNKSKSWAVSVFTSNILIMKGLFNAFSGLSSFGFRNAKSHKFFPNKNLFLVDESFFLFF